MLTDRLRTAPITGDYSDSLSPADLRGMVRFRRLMAPSDTEWSQYRARYQDVAKPGLAAGQLSLDKRHAGRCLPDGIADRPGQHGHRPPPPPFRFTGPRQSPMS